MAPGLFLVRRSAAAAAFGSAAVGFAAVAAAVAQSPWFSWTENALSDLGHPSHSSQLTFNIGLMVAGLVDLWFIGNLWTQVRRNARERSAIICLALGSLSLAFIGLFNESFGDLHFIVSGTYFAFIPVGIALFAPAAARADERLGRLSLLIAVMSALLGISILTAIEFRTPFTSQAIPELLASIIFGVWTCWAALLMWKGVDFRGDLT